MLTAIRRFFNEVRDPALKCTRLGHRHERLERRTIRKRLPQDTDQREPIGRYVALDCKEARMVCARCGNAPADWQIYMATPLHSISMSSDQADSLEICGFYVYG